ncbi:MAG: transglutaminase domain-containing protein [Chloroflexota bacterium]
MKVGITHTTRLSYGVHVVEGVMDVRLGPRSDNDQRWQEYDLRATPNAAIRRYYDGFGNAAHLVTIARPHDEVVLVSRGVVDTLLVDPFQPLVEPAPQLGPSELADYLAPSTTVPHDDALEELAAPFRTDSPEETFAAVQGLMDLVYREFQYEQHVTTVATTVPEVLKGRTGVCQDFAHVLLGLCRAIGVPARYVSGYIVPAAVPRAQSQTLGTMSQSQVLPSAAGPSRGAGASHAWIEAYTPTHGWRGFDPTNNLLASTYHVKMSIGRDYNDVPPTRGTFRGMASETLAVEVEARILNQ